MPNRIPKLTRRAVEAIKPNGADTIYWDGELTGFALRIRKSGRKNYVLQTRVRGKLRWFHPSGQHGRITADEARAGALEILAQAKKGIDPRDADAKQQAEPVMADLGRRFLEEYVPVHCKPSTQGEYRRSVELFIDPAIGEMRIAEVERKDIAKLHFDLRDKPLPGEPDARCCFQRCSRSPKFGACGRTGPIPAGTSSATRRASASGSSRPRRPSGWARFSQKPRARCRPRSLPSACLLLTGCRLSEIQFLRWEDVKGDCIELPDAKTGGRTVPLGPEARALLAAPAPRGGQPLGHFREEAGHPSHRSSAPLAPHPRARRAGGRANS